MWKIPMPQFNNNDDDDYIQNCLNDIYDLKQRVEYQTDLIQDQKKQIQALLRYLEVYIVVIPAQTVDYKIYKNSEV